MKITIDEFQWAKLRVGGDLHLLSYVSYYRSFSIFILGVGIFVSW